MTKLTSGPTQKSATGPVRIALVTQGYFSAGGVQTVARWLRKNLLAGGFDVTVFEIEPSRNSRFSQSFMRPSSWFRGPTIEQSERESYVFHVGSNFSDLEIARYLPKTQLTRHLNGYDIVQVVCGGPALAYVVKNVSGPVAVQMATLMKLERQALISRSRGLARLRIRAMTSMVSLVEMKALRRANFVQVENDEIYDKLIKRGVSGLTLAPPGVDTRVFRPGDAEKTPQTAPLVYLGRLGEPRKGLRRLITAYIGCVENDPEFPDLILAGRGKLPTAEFEMIVSSGFGDKFAVRNDLTEEEKIALLQSSSLFVQTSYEEGLGVSVIEAMACGIPVIATATAGTAETVVSGETGFLISQEEFDRATLQESVYEILARYQSFSENSRTVAVEKFSDKVTFRNYISAYKCALEGPV